MLYIVLGAPRTGTSLVAGMLHGAGIHMGRHLNPPGYGNEAGFFEDLEFISSNQILLRMMGCDLYNPPTHTQLDELVAEAGIVTEYLHLKADLALREGYEDWGFKDGRVCLLLPLYTPGLVQFECRFVITHRNPMACTRSFMRVWPERFRRVAPVLALVAQYELAIARFLVENMALFDSGQWQGIHASFEALTEEPEVTLNGMEAALGLELAREHLRPELRHF